LSAKNSPNPCSLHTQLAKAAKKNELQKNILYNLSKESVDAYADMLFDLQQLTSRAIDFPTKALLPKDTFLFNNSKLSWLYF